MESDRSLYATDANSLADLTVRVLAAAPYWISLPDFLLVHGAFHPDMLTCPSCGIGDDVPGRLKALSLYGETDGSLNERKDYRSAPMLGSIGFHADLQSGWTRHSADARTACHRQRRRRAGRVGCCQGRQTLHRDHFAAAAEALKKELERAPLRLCSLPAYTFTRTHLFTSRGGRLGLPLTWAKQTTVVVACCFAMCRKRVCL